MIRCHYTPETLETVAKAGKCQKVSVVEILAGLSLLVLIERAINDPSWLSIPVALVIPGLLVVSIPILGFVVVCQMRYFNANITRTVLENADDEIIMDDEYIQQIKEDGTKIMLPRQGLKAAIRYGAPEHKMFDIWNPDVDPNLKITLTSHMDNAKELVNAIKPRTWGDD